MTVSPTYPHRPQSELTETYPRGQKTPLIHYHTSKHTHTIHTKLHTLRLLCLCVLLGSLYGHSWAEAWREDCYCRMVDCHFSSIGAPGPVCHKACPGSLPKAGGLTQAGPDVRKGSRGALVHCANAFQYGQTSVPSAGAQPAPSPPPRLNPSA